MGGWKSRVKDCLQQSKNYWHDFILLILKNEEQLNLIGLETILVCDRMMIFWHIEAHHCILFTLLCLQCKLCYTLAQSQDYVSKMKTSLVKSGCFQCKESLNNQSISLHFGLKQILDFCFLKQIETTQKEWF